MNTRPTSFSLLRSLACNVRLCTLPWPVTPRWLWLVGWLLCSASGLLHAQSGASNNPTGPTGDYNGEVTTGGSYDPFTANAKRVVTDLVVPGSNGTYPLAFARTYNSGNAPVAYDDKAFGDGGWRHAYMWTVSMNTLAGSSGIYSFDVAYPDGRVVTFVNKQYQTAAVPSQDPYWRGPTGVQDRLEVTRTGSNAVGGTILHLSDGGLVRFSDNHHPLFIVDPYGATTKLEYTGNLLRQVTEPGGRTLSFNYKYPTVNGKTWGVIDYVTASTGQKATYNYQPYGGQGNGYYLMLASVVYNYEDSTAGGGNKVQASYGYTQTTGARPLLTTAQDPHYAGAMTGIRYAYSDYTSGYILEEQNINTSERVSRLDHDAAGPVETRGDKASNGGGAITRAFHYGEATSPHGGATNAKPSQLTTVTDFEGHNTYLYYYGDGDKDGAGAGNLFASVDALGNSTTYNHEPITGKVNAMTLPDQRQRSWLYWSKNAGDGNGNLQPYYLLWSKDERGQQTNYTRYPDTGLVHFINYPDSASEEFVYTGFNGPNGTYYKLGYHKTKLGAQIYYNYGSNPSNPNNANQQPDLLRSVTRYYNDGSGTMRSEVTYFDYDALDRLYLTTDPRNVATRTTYNARHQLVQTMHMADNTHVDRYYDDLGNCTYVTDELTHPTSFQYDEYRRPTVVVQDVQDGTNDHHVDYYSYDPRNASSQSISSATSHTRATWSYHQQQSSRATFRVFSPNNWLTDTYAGMSAAGSIHVDYTATGQPQSGTDAFGYQTVNTYDACDRLTDTKDPNDHHVSTSYYGVGEAASGGGGTNCTGLLKSMTVPGPDLASPTVTTQMANYDPMGRLLKTIAPTNSYNVTNVTTDSAYNAAGDLTHQNDGAQISGGHDTGYGYDGLGRKVSIAYPDGTFERWTYDAAGNVATYKTRAQQTATFGYDGRNRCTSKSWGNGAAPNIGYEYDAASRTTRVFNDRSDNHFTYSYAGELLTETAQLPSMPLKTITYSHDIDGRVTAILYPHGDQPHFDYDAQGKCTGVWFGNNTYYSKSIYDGKNQLAYRTLPIAGLVTGYGYQKNSRVSYVWDYKGDANGNHTANQSIRLQYYGYAPGGQVSWTYRVAGGDQSGRNSQLDNNQGDAYYYFPDGSLNAAWRNFGTKNNAWPAQQDPKADARVDPGNLVSYGGPAPSDARAFPFDPAGNRSSSGNSNYAYTYNPEGENRYQGMGYDANGNTTSPNDGFYYTYNAENQLTGISNSNGLIAAFAYDGLGRMWGDNYNGLAKAYYYAGSQRIEEYNNISQASLNQYYFDAPGSDAIFLRVNQAYGSQAARYVWYLYDALGNTTHLCDNGGNVLEMYLYDAWGKPTVYDPSGNVRASGSAYDNRYLFKGAAAYQWYTPASLYYCRARFYQPFHGRWLQPDPIGQAGGLNIYTYCGNDPINGVDASGLADDSNGSIVIKGFFHGLDASRPQYAIGLDGNVTNVNQAGSQPARNGIGGSFGPGQNSTGGNSLTFAQRGVATYSGFGEGPSSGGTAFRSPEVLRIVVPGQIHFDNMLNNYHNGYYGYSALSGAEMLAEQVIFVCSLGTSKGVEQTASAVTHFTAEGGVTELRTVTSWASRGVTPELSPGRWVQLGEATPLNFLKSGLPGPKLYFLSKSPFLRMESSNVPFSNSITGTVQESSLLWPPGWEVWKGILGQRQIKP